MFSHRSLPLFFLFLAFLKFPSFYAQSSGGNTKANVAPKYANEFLNIGVGARALGMSLSQVASVNDITAGYWNPAGLSAIQDNIQAVAMHTEYFAGIAKYDYAAIGKSIDSTSTLAVSFLRLGVDDIPNTIDLIDPSGNINYNRITTFSAVDYAFLISYAKKGIPWKGHSETSSLVTSSIPLTGHSWGVNAKILYRHIGDFARAWGFGLDAGIQFKINDKWLFGAVAKDITSTFSAWSYSLDERTQEVFQQTGNDIPSNGLEIALPRVITGIGRNFQIKKINILAEVNAIFTTDGKRNTWISGDPISIDPSAGVEVGYNQRIFLRLGAGNIQRTKNFDGSGLWTIQPNLGVGLRIKRLQLDYALSNIGNVSDIPYSNIFSLQFAIH